MNRFGSLFKGILLCCLASIECTFLWSQYPVGESDPNFYREESAFDAASPRAATHFISLGRSFDNSDFFSAGISSYQGTSTGPGPNGGYPGAPRGVYPTRYVDTSLYPNNYPIYGK